MFVQREIEEKVRKSLNNSPVTAILGPRQCGKTTLIKKISNDFPDSIYLDLEKPSDKIQLTDAETFFKMHPDKLICIDEIQMLPDIFPVIRSIADDKSMNIRFIITGSASPELLRQSSESLAGRIMYFELSPFLLTEIENIISFEDYWIRGGFPISILSTDQEYSIDWRHNFIRTFLERDIRNFGINISPDSLSRLWKMLSHLNGQILNYSQLSNSLGYSDTSVRKYIDILAYTYMVRVLRPFHANINKRLVKNPKIYLRDTGILHSLLNIDSFNELYSHPNYGSSYESLCIENIIQRFSRWEPYFYRTSNGSEIDLLLVKSNRIIAIECKASAAPKPTTGFLNAIKDLSVEKAFIIARVENPFPLKNNVMVYNLKDFLKTDL